MKKRGLILFICLLFLVCMMPNMLFAQTNAELIEAVKNSDGSEISLTSDVTGFSGALVRNDEKQATINLNGKTLTIDSNSTLTNIKFTGTGTVSISGNGSTFNKIIFENDVKITGNGNTFNDKTTFNKDITIKGSGNTFNNVIFNNAVEITSNGNGNTFSNETKFNRETTISGNSNTADRVVFNNEVKITSNGNTFSNETKFNGNTTISGQSNTFNDVDFIVDETETVDIMETGTNNTFNGGTTFSGIGTAYVKGKDNTFDDISFSCNADISGDSRFNSGTFERIEKDNNTKTVKVDISNGEFNGVIFEHVKSEIIGGEFNKLKDKECYFNSYYYEDEPDEPNETVGTLITGGVFYDVGFNDASTVVKLGDPGAEFYNPTFYNSKYTEIEENHAIKVSKPTYFERSNDKAGTIRVTLNGITEEKTDSLNKIIGDAGDKPVKLELLDDVKVNREEDCITIGGFQDVILDLNGHSITKADGIIKPTITLYGNLTIIDSSNQEYFYENENNEESSAVTVSKGYIDSMERISGTLLIRAGTFKDIIDDDIKQTNQSIFQNEEIADDYLDTRSYWYDINGKYRVINEGTLDYSLCYKIVDSNGNEVKSVDSDEIQDVSIGEKYSVKVYIKSDNDKAVRLRGFDITMKYNFKDGETGNVKIETPYTDNNRYYKVKVTETPISSDYKGKIEYVLIDDDEYTANFYIPKAIDESGHPIQNYEGLQIAQFDFTVTDAKVSTGIEFSFVEGESFDKSEDGDKAVSRVAVMRELGGVYKGDGKKPDNSVVNYIPVKSTKSLSLNTRSVYDGVRVADYIYAPEGYILAIISKEHRVSDSAEDTNYTVYYGNEPMWLVNDMNAKYYVNLSSNPELLNAKGEADKKIGGVYLKLINPEALVEDGLLNEADKSDYNMIMAAVEKKLNIREGKDTELKIGEKFDIDGDGKVDYNDASLVYRMIQKGGEAWGYDIGDKYNYLGEESRLLASASENRKLYGTIEDVVEIIKHYDSADTKTN